MTTCKITNPVNPDSKEMYILKNQMSKYETVIVERKEDGSLIFIFK